jgi:MOSC domain-containing protein
MRASATASARSSSEPRPDPPRGPRAQRGTEPSWQHGCLGTVVAIAVAPVKGLALELRPQVELTALGVTGDRRFYLVNDTGHLINQKRVPALATVVPSVADGRVSLRFPDGTVVEDEVALGAAVTTSFYGRPVAGRLVAGAFGEALSAHAGSPLRLVRAQREGDGLDRGAGAGVSLVSTGSLAALASAAGREHVDGRRFRMTLTVDGLGPHDEDEWLGRRVRAGGALLELVGNVGRCAVTTRDPDTGVRDLETLDLIEAYRGGLETTEPLPFGIWGRVLEPGRVAVGDAVEPV